jgi:hypothetical protein
MSLKLNGFELVLPNDGDYSNWGLAVGRLRCYRGGGCCDSGNTAGPLDPAEIDVPN